jgi:hypothetical protein
MTLQELIDTATPCAVCGKPIIWATTPEGEPMPVVAHSIRRAAVLSADGSKAADRITGERHLVRCPTAHPAGAEPRKPPARVDHRWRGARGRKR